MSDFGAALKAARLAAGLTQQEVADVFGATRSYVSRVEAGRSSPLSIERILDLRVVLHPMYLSPLIALRVAAALDYVPAAWLPSIMDEAAHQLTAMVPRD
jgi:transcriptional regulator with XRE-family HTH domain